MFLFVFFHFLPTFFHSSFQELNMLIQDHPSLDINLKLELCKSIISSNNFEKVASKSGWFENLLRENLSNYRALEICGLIREKSVDFVDAELVLEVIENCELEMEKLTNQIDKFEKVVETSNNLCSSIPSITTSKKLDLLSVYLSYTKAFTEFKRKPPKSLISKIKPDQTGNACLSIQLQNKILSKIFYQEMKYADKTMISQNLSKIADLSITSTDQHEINFAVACFTDFNEFKLDFLQNVDEFVVKVTKSPLLTVDWPWSPIIDVFVLNKCDDELGKRDLEVFNECLEIVTKTDEIENLAEISEVKSTCCVFLENISHETVYNRLLCTALSSSNVFFNTKLSNSMISLLKLLKISKITPATKNLYKQLLNHYEASSYGNINFSKFLLIPVVSEKFEPSSKKSPIFVEMHTSLFSEGLRCAHLAEKSTDLNKNDVECFITPCNGPATPVLAKNFAHFCATSRDADSDLFRIAVEYLKQFFVTCDEQSIFTAESDSLKKDLGQMGHVMRFL